MSEYANFHHRLPRQTAKRALIADNNSPLLPFNPLLSPQMNKGRISDEIRKITTDNTALGTTTNEKADNMASHEQQLAKLEAAVTALEKKVEETFDSDEDWDDDGDDVLDAADNDDDNGDNDDTDDNDNTEDWNDEDDDDGVRKVGPHRFLALVNWVARRDKVDHATAAETARKQYPKTYASYQRSDNGDDVGKNYRELVNAEIRKGRSPECAAQVVAYAHPQAAAQAQHDAINKSSVSQFMTHVDAIKKRDNCSRVEALERARREHPREFARYQNVT